MNKRVIQDALLGELIWNELTDTWEGYFEISPAIKTYCAFYLGEEPDFWENNRQRYLNMLDLIKRDEEKIRRYAAEEMIDSYNDNWREEDDPIVDIPTLMEDIAEINGIILYEEGNAQIFYESGDYFAYHAIIVELDANGECVRVTL